MKQIKYKSGNKIENAIDSGDVFRIEYAITDKNNNIKQRVLKNLSNTYKSKLACVMCKNCGNCTIDANGFGEDIESCDNEILSVISGDIVSIFK